MVKWHVDRWVRLIAGTFVLASVLLAKYVNPNWIWFAAFVGFMMIQSAFTKFCPMELILKALGVPELSAAADGKQNLSPDTKVAGF